MGKLRVRHELHHPDHKPSVLLVNCYNVPARSYRGNAFSQVKWILTSAIKRHPPAYPLSSLSLLQQFTAHIHPTIIVSTCARSFSYDHEWRPTNVERRCRGRAQRELTRIGRSLTPSPATSSRIIARPKTPLRMQMTNTFSVHWIKP